MLRLVNRVSLFAGEHKKNKLRLCDVGEPLRGTTLSNEDVLPWKKLLKLHSRLYPCGYLSTLLLLFTVTCCILYAVIWAVHLVAYLENLILRCISKVEKK